MRIKLCLLFINRNFNSLLVVTLDDGRCDNLKNSTICVCAYITDIHSYKIQVSNI